MSDCLFSKEQEDFDSEEDFSWITVLEVTSLHWAALESSFVNSEAADVVSEDIPYSKASIQQLFHYIF